MPLNMECKDWNPFEQLGIRPKVLLIGHDPRLQRSATIADYALFSDYYFKFKSEPLNESDRHKYGLAKMSFEQVLDITGNRYNREDIYVTNLCNQALERPKKRTVLIPEREAETGVKRLKKIVEQFDSIEYVFPMSQQVNYWLQYFELYRTETDFLANAKPKQKGIDSIPPYYEAINKNAKPFLEICGKVYDLGKGQKLIPILHTKTYCQLKEMRAYDSCYKQIRNYFDL